MRSKQESILQSALQQGKISEKGSLGLLALGDLGLKYWRKSKKEQSKQLPSEKT